MAGPDHSKHFEVLLTFIFVTLTGTLASETGAPFAILYVRNPETRNHGSYCVMYDNKFHELPSKIQDAEKLPLLDLTPNVLCDPPGGETAAINGTVAAVSRGNCSFSEKARLVQQYGGKTLLVVSKTGLNQPRANMTSDYQEINVTVAMVTYQDFVKAKSVGTPVMAQLYSPSVPHVDYNLILIWVMAVGTIMIGAFWSGRVKHQQYVRKVLKRAHPTQGTTQDTAVQQTDDDDETLDVSPKIILIFVVLMCAMLISLYFLYDYLVYLIIGMFCIASAASLYSCSKPFIFRTPCAKDCRLPPIKLPFISGQPEVRQIILALICLGVSIWWAVERKKDYAWVLQNFLGIVFCVHMMKTIRLPSLKACTILLVLLFFYDIFFVFITPLFTQSGQSVMVDVATGGSSSSGEQLPMVLKVPRFADSVASVCRLPYSLLGFGDILVPGMLVSFCHGFDLKVESARIYYVSTIIAYGIGLLVTFVALALMSRGQPALLYLVPFTLLTVLIIGWRRKELKHLWRGEVDISKAEASEQGTQEVPVTPGPTSVNPSDMAVEVSSQSSDNEQRMLINK